MFLLMYKKPKKVKEEHVNSGQSQYGVTKQTEEILALLLIIKR